LTKLLKQGLLAPRSASCGDGMLGLLICRFELEKIMRRSMMEFIGLRLGSILEPARIPTGDAS
jgi:hypothetical protein